MRISLAILLGVFSCTGLLFSGTFSAPELVADIVPGPQSSFPFRFCQAEGGVFFVARPISVNHANKLYFTNGTPTGTIEFPYGIDDRYAYGYRQFAGCGSSSRRVFYETLEVNPPGGGGLWASDATVSGTSFISSGSGILDYWYSYGIVPENGRLLFSIPNEIGSYSLYSSNGTSEGTIPLLGGGSEGYEGFGDFSSHAGFTYFSSGDPESIKLWRSDGSALGTTQYGPEFQNSWKSILRWGSLPAGTFQLLSDASSGEGSLYFVSWNGASELLRQVQQTWQISNAQFARTSTTVYFLDDFNNQVWVTDGTQQGTRPVFNYPPEPIATRYIFVVGDELYFPRSTELFGQELWRYSPSSDSVGLVADLCPGPCSSSPEIAVTSEGAFVTAILSPNGSPQVLWLGNDGEMSGTLGPFCGQNCIDSVFVLGHLEDSTLFMTPGSGELERIWSLQDGSLATTMLVEMDAVPMEIDPGGDSVAGNSIYFWRNTSDLGSEPWRIRALPQPCVSQDNSLCLGGTRLRVQVRWRDFEGREGEGHAFLITADTGDFWFFGPDNVELMVKIVDGSLANGHFWVYYGALSNVEYWITIDDTVTGVSKTYHNELGDFGSFGDIEAFPANPAGGVAPLRASAASFSSPPLRAPLSVEPTSEAGPCLPDSTHVCLLNDRFSVAVTWTNFAGQSGVGQAENLTSDTGYFWFFDPAILEIVVKLVDGSATNGQFWVYYGSLSNVEFEITVTDSWTGTSKPYRNPLGSFGSFGDIEAFPAP